MEGYFPPTSILGIFAYLVVPSSVLASLIVYASRRWIFRDEGPYWLKPKAKIKR